MDKVVPIHDPREVNMIMDREEFLRAFAEHMLVYVCEFYEDRELFRAWIKRLKMEDEIDEADVPFDDLDAPFWVGIVLGGVLAMAEELGRA
jgi:hypothetical protein